MLQLIYGRQDMPNLSRAQEGCVLLTNGLGGYASLSHAFSMTRADQGLLVSARTAPNDRVTLLARMEETLTLAGTAFHLSSQEFADDTATEDGWRHLSLLEAGDAPRWVYDVRGVRVTREVAMAFERNATAITYTVENRASAPCTLTLIPWMLGFEKGHAPVKPWPVAAGEGCFTLGAHELHFAADGAFTAEEPRFALQAYAHDAPDGRPEKGLVASAGCIRLTVGAGETKTLSAVFADRPCPLAAGEIIAAHKARMAKLRADSGLTDPVALQLVTAADAYIARRDSTGGKTILAGYPFFGDWGRDTMIALTGCTLATRRYDDAKSILRTFFQYEKEGLVPNLFPEGTAQPMYNTADAALLLINVAWLYVQRTGDMAFAREAFPVMARIVANYRKGTRHGIHMDADGLICAGEGFDQVTWMDVRVGEILPTPRHGKPVEINAYWYSALRIMDALARELNLPAADYAALAEKVGASFRRAFVRADGLGLRDVISGTKADEQIRCNQIWAMTMPFTMLTSAEEKQVLDTVYAHLYTPCGLRTLSPEDGEFRAVCEGEQIDRDMAYHQGTAWVFPLGAYWLAKLRVEGNTPEAARRIREEMLPLVSTLREGCAGQLPEIYNGGAPAFSRGCFAQAWSVGEILRVYEAVESIECKAE